MKEYFEEAKQWYYLKYIQSIRFIAFAVMTTLIATGMSIFAVQEAYKAVAKQERVTKVIYTNHDVSLFPVMEKIGKYYHSNDMNILLYTIKTYVTNFETYEKSDNQYLAYMQKTKYMQNYSSSAVLKLLQDKFNKEYAKKLENGGFIKAAVQNVDFNANQRSFMQSIHDFLMPTPIPKQAIVTVLLYIFDGKQLSKKTIHVELNIYFEKIQKQKNGKLNDIKFFISGYRYL